MSEMEEFSAFKAENSSAQDNQFDPMAVSAHVDKQIDSSQSLKEIVESLDSQAYLAGEIPQQFNFDPHSFQPLNSENLVGSVNFIQKSLGEVSRMVEEEVNQIQKFQKKINLWEDRIEKNKALIQKSLNKIKQNNTDIIYDKKNRDYWFGMAEQVNLDFEAAAAADRQADWAWLIKKYGLKNADGTEIDATHVAVEELCNGESDNLSGQYRAAGNKYEQSKKDRETENTRLIRENSGCLKTNDQLQAYISNTYTNEIEPLQDGVLLLKEVGVKLKALHATGSKATYGELRAWAEQFLDDFLKSNPRVPQSLVTVFRRLTSISLPADHC
jgi:hypothetical protein